MAKHARVFAVIDLTVPDSYGVLKTRSTVEKDLEAVLMEDKESFGDQYKDVVVLGNILELRNWLETGDANR